MLAIQPLRLYSGQKSAQESHFLHLLNNQQYTDNTQISHNKTYRFIL